MDRGNKSRRPPFLVSLFQSLQISLRTPEKRGLAPPESEDLRVPARILRNKPVSRRVHSSYSRNLARSL